MAFGPLVTAMVTPFTKEDTIDFPVVTTLVEHLIETGSTGIVVSGTTGESPTLTTDEKLQLLSHVIKTVNGRVHVIAGTGGNNTKSSIELTKKAEELGADAVMLVTPYYNKPSQEGMYQHFAAIANSTKLPVLLYNIPGRSVVNMETETVVRLSKIENIVAIKEASGNLAQMTNIIRETDDDFVLYSGDDGITLPVLSIGGVGVVSVASHIAGKEMTTMINEFNNGNFAVSSVIHGMLEPVIEALFMAPNPTAVKEALKIQGIDVGSVRLPLVPLTNEQELKLNKALEGLKKLNN